MFLVCAGSHKWRKSEYIYVISNNLNLESSVGLNPPAAELSPRFPNHRCWYKNISACGDLKGICPGRYNFIRMELWREPQGIGEVFVTSRSTPRAWISCQRVKIVYIFCCHISMFQIDMSLGYLPKRVFIGIGVSSPWHKKSLLGDYSPTTVEKSEFTSKMCSGWSRQPLWKSFCVADSQPQEETACAQTCTQHSTQTN